MTVEPDEAAMTQAATERLARVMDALVADAMIGPTQPPTRETSSLTLEKWLAFVDRWRKMAIRTYLLLEDGTYLSVTARYLGGCRRATPDLEGPTCRACYGGVQLEVVHDYRASTLAVEYRRHVANGTSGVPISEGEALATWREQSDDWKRQHQALFDQTLGYPVGR
jgi:hypothetical protein